MRADLPRGVFFQISPGVGIRGGRNLLRPSLGDDTLVVDTVGFLPGFLNPPVRNSDQLHVVERFVLDPKKMALTRSYTAQDAVYLKGKYTGSDTILVADAPFNPGKCKELNFIDYSKEQRR